MSGTIARVSIRATVGAGVFAAALALSPDAVAAPLKTGGYECIQDAAGGDPAAAFCAPVADMAGIPMALPGPLPLGAAAVPVPVAVPPVPVGVPPVPVGVPPVPVGVPPVPVGVPPVPVGAGAVPLGAPLPVGAPIIDMSGGKGAATGPAPAGAPAPGQPIAPGPAAS